MSSSGASLSVLKALAQAFNDHDLDRIMSFFADDAVLEMPRGPDPWGRRYVGVAAIREGLRARFTGLPDVHYGNDSHYIDGDMGISQWTVTGTTPAGERVEARGCDFYSFRDGKITKKDSFWKIVEK
jgi:ketosteroid isomerase-like protein